MKRNLLILLVVLIPIISRAEPAAFPLTGTFSDMRCIEQEGDVLGLEVRLMAGLEAQAYRYFAVVQFAEGAAGIPQLVPVSVDGDKVEFTANYLGFFDVQFSGEVSEIQLSGRLGKPLDNDVRLPRTSGFWQSPGDLCYR